MIKRPAALSRSGRNSRMTSLGSGGSPQRERSRAVLRSARRGSPGYICRARRHQWTRTRTDENSLELTSPVIEGSEGFDTVKMDGTEGEAARGAVKRGRRFGRWPRREGRVPYYKFAPVSKTTHNGIMKQPSVAGTYANEAWALRCVHWHLLIEAVGTIGLGCNGKCPCLAVCALAAKNHGGRCE